MCRVDTSLFLFITKYIKMILPKIEYENSLSTVFDGDNVIAITLRNSSVGSDIDV